jgi:tRNA (guanine37-N1)-methyltransferase
VTRRFSILTLFPTIFDSFLDCSLIGKAVEAGRLVVETTDIRDFATDPHRSVDDAPFGGGAGMVMKPGPVVEALHRAPAGLKVLLTPQGERYTQQMARELSGQETLVLVCGRYEGFDERIRQHVDREVSLGDFVLHGGEVAAMAIIESIARLGEHVLGNPDSSVEESFAEGLLEYPQYTRPRTFDGHAVPEVLLGGNHAAIDRWRRQQRLLRTHRRRPELLGALDEEDRRLLREALDGEEP